MKHIALVFAVILFMGAGCLGVSGSSQFGVGDWTMVSFETAAGGVQDVSSENFTLSLGEDDFMGAVICNDMGGDYTIEGGELMVPELVTTLKLCTGLAGDVEPVFMTDIANGLTIEGEGEEMMLVGDSGARFVYVREGAGMGNADDEPRGEAMAATGVVTNVDLEGVALDGPAIVMIEGDDGTPYEIHVPSFGILLCPAHENITDVFALEAGDVVEVNGEMTAEGAIVPCSTTEHYLRVIN